MTTLITSIIDPLLILIIMLASLILPAILLRREREEMEAVPRNYIEELWDFLRGVKRGKPVEAAETLFEACTSLGLVEGIRARVWRSLLTGPPSKFIPASIYRWILSRLISS
ncbi:hypothetical protein HRbin02_01445 [Candidatus Calditenuaceae archaeon HR02]|nr:hypothetical protein HRbin02_01445 [Candidatus Calditenuaceae archaeon HR02]